MMEWLNTVVPYVLKDFSLYGYLLVFLAGIVTGLGPCNLSLMPIWMAHVGGDALHRRRAFTLSVAFVLGTATTVMVLGLVIATVGGVFEARRSILYYFVAAVCLVIGLNLVGMLRLNINFGGNLLNRTGEQKGYGGSYLLGLVMGLVGSQCGTPVLIAILSLALASGQWLYGATLLFVYALGSGVPLVAVGTFTGLLTRMDQFARWNSVAEKAAGLLLIFMGGYFAWIA